MHTAARTIIQQIIRASTIDGEDEGVYFLGPFARRVSFAAQQHRALNLVYALREQERLREPVAVIGAGLAGVMIVSVLVALGLHVDLFEQNPQILARQRNTRHRFVHPTVNAWPDHTSLDVTTQLPIFDWCAGACNEVISVIDHDWTPIKERLSAQNRLHLQTQVVNYRVRRTGITLETMPSSGGQVFGTVIFATGFEEEKTVKNVSLTSYWDADNFERARDSDGSKRFVVSGIGDGGLIDSLRLVHSKFDGGVIAVRAATALFDTAIAHRVGAAEAEFSANRNVETERRLETIYEESARDLPLKLLAYLESSLIKVSALVWLVGKSDTPFGTDAAPIHKLLVAHAIQKGSINYIKGKVTVDRKKKITISPRALGPRLPVHFAVIRHGADNSLQKFLQTNRPKLEKLISAQKQLSDDLVEPFWLEGKLFHTLGYPARDPGSKEFRDSRFRRAKSIERIWDLNLAKGENGFIIEIDKTNEWIETDKIDGWRPTQLFGIPVTFDPIFTETVAR